jgi:hypothetical protein
MPGMVEIELSRASFVEKFSEKQSLPHQITQSDSQRTDEIRSLHRAKPPVLRCFAEHPARFGPDAD